MRLKTTTPENSSGGTGLANGPGSSSGPPRTNIGAIAGGAIGGLVAVALGFVAAEVLRQRRQGILGLFSHLKSPPASSGTLGEGCIPAELIAHTQVSRGGKLTVELPAEEVAREMEDRY